MGRIFSEKGSTYALSILLGLFVARCLCQFLQYIYPLPWLPAFERWQSGTLPYGLLLLSQVVITISAAILVLRISKGKLKKNKRIGDYLYGIGIFYFCASLLRFFIGYAYLPQDPFWGASIPAFFHMVLASWIILFGLYLRIDK
jgi:hypothetical protein